MGCSLYDLIMGNGTSKFTKDDWSALGKGHVMDEDVIKQMLMEGYETVASDE